VIDLLILSKTKKTYEEEMLLLSLFVDWWILGMAQRSHPDIKTGAIFFEPPDPLSLNVIKTYADRIYVHYQNVNKRSSIRFIMKT